MATAAKPDEVVRKVVGALDHAGVPYMLTGSLASSLHGIPRTTQDINFVIAPTAPSLERLLDSFPEKEYYVSRDAARNALRQSGLFNIIDLESGWKIDLIIQKQRDFSRLEFGRRVPVNVLGMTMFVATPEDVLLSKLEWAKRSESERQIEDAAGILRTQAAGLDVTYVELWSSKLGLIPQWELAKTKAA